MVTIFHLSDLHIDPKADNHQWERMKKELLDIAQEQSTEKQRILIVTGDFHNYSDADYTKARDFLIDLTNALGLERAKDLFVIPGNHDVGSKAAVTACRREEPDWKTERGAEKQWEAWSEEQEDAVDYFKTHSSDHKRYAAKVEKRLSAYLPYCRFVRSLGLYDGEEDEYLPARVHVRCWRSRLNLLHLNTTLVAAGQVERAEHLDIKAAEGDVIWRGRNRDFPALALGHNSFYDLDEKQQERLKVVFRENSVCAYLCGDMHKEENDPKKQRIDLNTHRSATEHPIPNVVGVKGAASEDDPFSDFGLYVHEWDEDTHKVRLKLFRWLSKEAQPRFRIEDERDDYYMPRPKPEELLQENSAYRDEIARLREELKKKEGEPPESKRERKARELWSEGETDAALALLDAKKRKERTDGSVRQSIGEAQLQIEILTKSKGLNRETIPKIRACYEECVALAKAHEVSVYVLYDYAAFLDDLNDHPPAIEAARWLLDYYRRENEPEEEQAKLENLLGILLWKNNQMDEAEALYREALAIRRRLAETNPAAYEPDVATTCNNLANLLKDTNRMDEAELLCREALAIRRRLAETNPAAYEPKVATTCNNLAILLKDTNQMDEAEALYREALDVYRRLAETNPAAYEPDVAMTCNNLGCLLDDMNRKDEAEALYREALDVYRRLAETNPAAYEPKVAQTCFNLGLFLIDARRKSEAKPLFEEAARLWDKYPHHSGYAQKARDLLGRRFKK